MLIDTHCHLDAADFHSDRRAVIERFARAGVGAVVIPAVDRHNLEAVRDLAAGFDGGAYALGIHPMCVPAAHENDLADLETHIEHAQADPRFVAIGEIGLDFFLPELREPAMRAKQEAFYAAQLDLAIKYALPVLLHVRRSQDILLKHLRSRPRIGGIGHAFNGSFQQAEHFIGQGFALGFGGAMTFTRALQIRRLATRLPIESLVLETDAPDIPPAWLETGARNEPAHLPRIAQTLADLRGMPLDDVVRQTGENALRVLPRLRRLPADDPVEPVNRR